MNEIYRKPLKRNYITNKTDNYHIDDSWSLDILDLKVYGPGNNRGYIYVLVIIDNFSKLGWTVPLKNKNAEAGKEGEESGYDHSIGMLEKRVNDLVFLGLLRRHYPKDFFVIFKHFMFSFFEIPGIEGNY